MQRLGGIFMHADSNEFKKATLSSKHHMSMPWHNFVRSNDHIIASDAPLREKASLVGRVGLMMLSCGTGAWRVRDSMNTIARVLGLTCSADVGLISIEYTCIENGHNYTQALALPTTGVNTDKLCDLEHFVRYFEQHGALMSIEQIHIILDKIEHKKGNYSPLISGIASGLACSAFVFLLGGGLIEMLCCLIGAFVGNYIRKKMLNNHLTLLACISVSVASACLAYLLMLQLLTFLFNVSSVHEAGYIGSMLFVIPGFPFITSGLDLAKLDMRSGIERMVHSLFIITVATLVGWVLALLFNFKPSDFVALNLNKYLLALLRLLASFCGVFGFSIMFNSPYKMASVAGIIGALANTLRLELVDLSNCPPALAAFLGALVAGLLASLARQDYPRISLTVPAIVIMVPGLYMYRAVYNIGTNSINSGALWLTKASLIVLFLPLGLILARILTDKKWRHCS